MILQTRFDNGYKVFIDLGEEFHYVDKEACPDQFQTTAEEEFGKSIKEYIDECYAFLVYGNGSKSEPLYSCHEHILLNNAGGVFRDLTFK